VYEGCFIKAKQSLSYSITVITGLCFYKWTIRWNAW